MRGIQARRGVSVAVVLFVACALSACGTSPRSTQNAGDELAAKLSERLDAADKAQKQGKTDEALATLEAAVKLDPASKQPWLRKAQIHFDARQYGAAITASQEVLQRDTTDLTAKSIMAVSGLRVSAEALDQLRKANEVNGSARAEAESVAKLIREALGEPILVPTSAASPDAVPARAAGRALRPAKPRPVATPSAPAVAPAKPATPTASANPPGGGARNNPFGALQ